MKPSLKIIVVILSFGIEACSATYVLSTDPQQTPYFTTQYMSFNDLLAKGRGETFTIVMTDGNRVHGTLLRADSANLAWSDVTTHEIHKVPTFLVHHLELTRNYVWEGGAIGLLVFTVPLLAEGGWEPQYHSRLDDPDYSWRFVTVIGGVFGGFVGAAVGNSIKTTDIFQIAPGGGK